jgi:succinoglycan biosynthesis transport protein ExoP
LQQVAAINRTVFDTLRSRLEQLAMDKQSTSNEYTIRVLDRAYVPAGRDQDWPLWWLNIVAGLFLALAFGVGGAFVLEYWSRPVLAARDVEQVGGVRFLGRFPELDERSS